MFVVAICGLVYELLAGTLGSYLLGDSVTQFSLVIGLYLSAMGGGAWLSRRLETDLARRFLELELAVAVVGGASAPVLFLAFGLHGWSFEKRRWENSTSGQAPRSFTLTITMLIFGAIALWLTFKIIDVMGGC